jgi:hypothetical protein
MMIMDHYIHWAEAVSLVSTIADSGASTLIEAWIARFSVPSAITSDRGLQFAGAVWAVPCKQMGVHHIQMPVYHSREMGSLRVQCWPKAALRARNVALRRPATSLGDAGPSGIS